MEFFHRKYISPILLCHACLDLLNSKQFTYELHLVKIYVLVISFGETILFHPGDI